MTSYNKEGFLKKDPGMFGGTKRYYILNPEGRIIQSFDKQGKEAKLKESLDLEPPEDIAIEILDEKKYIFKIGNKKATWKLQGADKGDVDSWIDTVKKFLVDVSQVRSKKAEERKANDDKKKEEDRLREEERKKFQEEKRKVDEARKAREEKSKTKKGLDSDDDSDDDEVGQSKEVAVMKKGLDSDDDVPAVKPGDNKPIVEESSDDDDSSDASDKSEGDVRERMDVSSLPKPTSIKDALDQMENYATEESIVERGIEYLERKFDSDSEAFNKEFLEHGGIQTAMAVLEVHYKVQTFVKFLIPTLLPLVKNSEENQHLCRLMNGISSIANAFTTQEKDSLDVPLSRDCMVILAALVKKKNDYQVNFMKNTEVLTKIIDLADALVRRSFETAIGFHDFISGLCSYEGNAQILFNCGAIRPIIKAIKKHAEEKYEILMTYYQLMAGVKTEDLEECGKDFPDCVETIVFQVMSKYDRDVTVLKIVSGVFQKLSASEDVLKALIKVYEDNEDDAAVALNVSYILYHLVRVQRDIPQETLVIWEKVRLVRMACEMMNHHRSVGWLMNYCISFCLYMIEKSDKNEKIQSEFIAAQGFDGVYFALLHYKTSDEVAIVCIRLLDIMSQNEENLKPMKTAVGLIQSLLEYIMHVKSTPDCLIPLVVLKRFTAKITPDKEPAQELIGFLMKRLDEDRHDSDISSKCFDVLYNVIKDDPFEIQIDEARMLADNIKNCGEENEDYVASALLFFGVMARMNKNRETFAKHGCISALKIHWKKFKDLPDVAEAGKEAVKTLAL